MKLFFGLILVWSQLQAATITLKEVQGKLESAKSEKGDLSRYELTIRLRCETGPWNQITGKGMDFTCGIKFKDAQKYKTKTGNEFSVSINEEGEFHIPRVNIDVQSNYKIFVEVYLVDEQTTSKKIVASYHQWKCPTIWDCMQFSGKKKDRRLLRDFSSDLSLLRIYPFDSTQLVFSESSFDDLIRSHFESTHFPYVGIGYRVILSFDDAEIGKNKPYAPASFRHRGEDPLDDKRTFTCGFPVSPWDSPLDKYQVHSRHRLDYNVTSGEIGIPSEEFKNSQGSLVLPFQDCFVVKVVGNRKVSNRLKMRIEFDPGKLFSAVEKQKSKGYKEFDYDEGKLPVHLTPIILKEEKK